jgi:hypothetical protein
MEYRKLNLIDGDDKDLQDFMSLLKETFEARAIGSSSLIDVEMMSKLISSGILAANVAEDKEGVAGLQVIEIAQFWFDASKKYKNIRTQFLRDNKQIEHLRFLQWTANQEKSQGFGVSTTIDWKDQLSGIVGNFDLTDFGQVKIL